MWSYYGSKKILAKLYPPPKHHKIIEPFCGTAQYSLLHWQNDITIIDKSPIIINIWEYLKQASPKDILSLPEIKLKQRIIRDDFDCEGQFNLMQFLIHQGAFSPGNIVQEFGILRYKSTKKKIASNLHKIRHWKMICDSYENIPNQFATWFVDPPYVHGGQKYTFGSKKIDFGNLSEWCRSRLGQVIVCENMKASWLPFVPIKKIRGINKQQSTEAMWTNEPSSIGMPQGTLF